MRRSTFPRRRSRGARRGCVLSLGRCLRPGRLAPRSTAGLCSIALAALVGCGGGATRQPPPPQPAVTHHAGGAILAACAIDTTVAVARSAAVDLWRFPPQTPPVFVEQVPLGPSLGPPVDHLRCTDDGISVGRGAVRWRVDPQTFELVPLGAGVAALPALPVTLPLGAERTAVFEPGRFGVTHPTGDQAWRPTSGPLNAATYDGEVVWAVGVSGLWRWRPGPGRPMAVPLPDEWIGRALTGVFRDASHLWIRDAAGVGVPLDVRGARPRSAGDAGPLPVADRGRRVPAAGQIFEGRLGENAVEVDGESRSLEAPLEAVSAFRDGVLLAAGGALRFWGGDDLREVWRSPLPGATVALFALSDGRVMAVGRRYGFMALDFRQPLGQ